MSQGATTKMDWKPEGYVCIHCGTPNPDHGDRCGNCDEKPFAPRKGLATRNEFEVLSVVRGAKRARKEI